MSEKSVPQTQPEAARAAAARKARVAGSFFAGGLLVGGVAGGLIVDQSGTVNHLKYESQAKTESLAAAQAAAFTAALYDDQQYPKGVPMPVLNGEIRTTIRTADGIKHTGVYKDPILLATSDIDAKPDTKGDFLKGGWIGIRGNDQNGKAVIHAVRFNQAGEQFVAYTQKPTDIIFPDLAAYASADEGGPGLDGLIGFDATGEHTNPTNGDGSVITPGLSTGMK